MIKYGSLTHYHSIYWFIGYRPIIARRAIYISLTRVLSPIFDLKDMFWTLEQVLINGLFIDNKNTDILLKHLRLVAKNV